MRVKRPQEEFCVEKEKRAGPRRWENWEDSEKVGVR